jgi:hypothetical protein
MGSVEGMPTSAQRAMNLGQRTGDRGGGAVCATEKKRTNTRELGHLRRWITHRERLRRAGN